MSHLSSPSFGRNNGDNCYGERVCPIYGTGNHIVFYVFEKYKYRLDNFLSVGTVLVECQFRNREGGTVFLVST